MDSQYIQNLRYKLQKRVRRLGSVDGSLIQPTVKQFWVWFDSQPALAAIDAELIASYPDAKAVADRISEGEALAPDDEGEAAAIGRVFLRRLAEGESPENVLINSTVCFGTTSRLDELLELFRDAYLEPFYEHVDEQLDDERATLGVLLRYKRRSEWFHAARLRELSQAEARKAEATLALDLYDYLWDHGIDFMIEPSSIRGEVDVIEAQPGDDPLLADVKVFDADSRGKTYLRKAFRQVYTYCQQYNRPFGYLVIFKVTDRDLHLALKQHSLDIPHVSYNHKTIFFLVVDIHDYEAAVSKRSPLKAIELTEEEMVQSVEDK